MNDKTRTCLSALRWILLLPAALPGLLLLTPLIQPCIDGIIRFLGCQDSETGRIIVGVLQRAAGAALFVLLPTLVAPSGKRIVAVSFASFFCWMVLFLVSRPLLRHLPVSVFPARSMAVLDRPHYFTPYGAAILAGGIGMCILLCYLYRKKRE